jgi:hypothetical protein
LRTATSKPSGIENNNVSAKIASVVQKPPQRIGSKEFKSDIKDYDSLLLEILLEFPCSTSSISFSEACFNE